VARQINKLNPKSIAAPKEPGRYGDGQGLYLNVAVGGSRSWIFLYRSGGRLREMGLGSVASVSLAEARALAAEARSAIGRGVDPIGERRRERAKGTATFQVVATELYENRRERWAPRTQAQWLKILERHCKLIWDMPVDQIDVAKVVAVLKPIWLTKSETGGRVRAQVEMVLDSAKVRGLIPDDRANPARWKAGLSHLLAKKPRLQRGHHSAAPLSEIPTIVTRLRERPAIAARCLEFTILNACRSQESLRSRWREIDLEKRIWSIPAFDAATGERRMKGGVAHVVPLSDRALEILADMERGRHPGSDFVFCGEQPGRSLSGTALRMLHARMLVGYTIHGYRSCFKDWCSDVGGFPDELSEVALAHQVGTAARRAYARSDMIERRRAMMQAWADFCSGKAAENIIQLRTVNQ
jgi:integrase